MKLYSWYDKSSPYFKDEDVSYSQTKITVESIADKAKISTKPLTINQQNNQQKTHLFYANVIPCTIQQG